MIAMTTKAVLTCSAYGLRCLDVYGWWTEVRREALTSRHWETRSGFMLSVEIVREVLLDLD